MSPLGPRLLVLNYLKLSVGPQTLQKSFLLFSVLSSLSGDSCQTVYKSGSKSTELCEATHFCSVKLLKYTWLAPSDQHVAAHVCVEDGCQLETHLFFWSILMNRSVCCVLMNTTPFSTERVEKD